MQLNNTETTVQPNVFQVLRFWMELDKFYSRWRIPYMAYKGETYPPYCTGDFYFFSNSVLHQIVSHCPSHCIHDRGESYDPTRCFWRFEDVFFGSCVSNFETPPNFANLPSVFRLEIPYTKRITQFIELHRRAHRISLVHLVKNSTYFFKLHQAFYNHDVYTPSVDKFLMYKKVFVNENWNLKIGAIQIYILCTFIVLLFAFSYSIEFSVFLLQRKKLRFYRR